MQVHLRQDQTVIISVFIVHLSLSPSRLTITTSVVSTLKKHAVRWNYIQMMSAKQSDITGGARRLLLHSSTLYGAFWNAATRWQHCTALFELVPFLLTSKTLKRLFTKMCPGKYYRSRLDTQHYGKVNKPNCLAVFCLLSLLVSFLFVFFFARELCLCSLMCGFLGASKRFHNVLCVTE